MAIKNQSKTKINLLFVIILIVSLFTFFGCETQAPQNQDSTDSSQPSTSVDNNIEEEPSEVTTPETKPEPDTTPEETLDPISEVEEEEPTECTSDIPVHNLDDFKLTLNDEGEEILFDENGYSIRIFPVDKDGNLIKLEGNLKIDVMMTDSDINDKVKTGDILYSRNIYLPESKVLPDCGSERIYIKYSDLEKQTDYRFIRDGDLGELVIVLKRSGSDNFYGKVFKGIEDGYSFLKPE